MSAVLAVSATTASTFDLPPPLPVFLASTAIVCAACVATHRWLPSGPRVAMTLLFTCATVAAALGIVGFGTPNPFVVLFALMVLGSLLLERTLTALLFATSLVMVVGAALYFVQAPVPKVPQLNSQDPWNWVRVTTVFTVVTLGVLFCIDRFLLALKNSLLHSQKLLVALQRESEQREANLLALKSAQRLEALGRLSGGICHDFNNLLMIVQGNAELARSTWDHAERMTALEEIGVAARRGADLTRQLLDFTGRSVATVRGIEFAPAFEETTRFVARLLPESVTLRVECDARDGAVAASRSDLNQILMNLTLNARDAMPQGGTLKISGSRDGETFSIGVSDSGTGMAQEVLEHVFEPFFTTKGPSKGTGLGLSVVHGIVRSVGGTIEVESKVGAGTTFRITLPCGDATDPLPRALEVDTRGRGETILVVDDDDAVRSVMIRTLERAGYRTIAAADGAEAIERFHTADPVVALVLTDSVLPRVPGERLCQVLTGESPNLPFLFCSGYLEPSLDPERLRGPGRGFLAKPFGASDLIAEVARLLAAQRPPASHPTRGSQRQLG